MLAINLTSIRVRVSSRSDLEIDLPPLHDYDIVRPETITLAVPEAAIVSRRRPAMRQAWTILPSAGIPSVRVSPDGPLLVGIRELALRINGSTLVFQMASDGFVPPVGEDTLETVNLIDAILSEQNEPGGWNHVSPSAIH